MNKPLMVGLLLLSTFALPQLRATGYPVLDVPDLVIDIAGLIVDIETTASEIEKYRQLYEQFDHWKDQAQKLRGRDLFSLADGVLFAEADIGPLFIAMDADLETLLTCLDGQWDLRHELARLRRACETHYPAMANNAQLKTGGFQVGGDLADRFEASEAAFETWRALLGHGWAWVGESKFNTKTDRPAYRRAQDLFGAAEGADDTRGRQLGYDLINADLVTVRGVTEKRQALVQALGAVRGLRRAVERATQRDEAELIERSLQQLSRDASDFYGADGHELLLHGQAP